MTSNSRDWNPKAYRCVVTDHRGGKAIVLHDAKLSPYAFKNRPGFEHAYVRTTRRPRTVH